jgi:hypothetical protein
MEFIITGLLAKYRKRKIQIQDLPFILSPPSLPVRVVTERATPVAVHPGRSEERKGFYYFSW